MYGREANSTAQAERRAARSELPDLVAHFVGEMTRAGSPGLSQVRIESGGRSSFRKRVGGGEAWRVYHDFDFTRGADVQGPDGTTTEIFVAPSLEAYFVQERERKGPNSITVERFESIDALLDQRSYLAEKVPLRIASACGAMLADHIG